MRTAVALIPAAAVLGFVFAFRFLSFTGFPNDHFVYVARAQQILLGAWPVRDFVDPGFLGMYAASAAALTVFGHNLLGEALLVFGGFAVAAALSYGLARAAAGSFVVAIVAVVLQALAYPRSYSYPKLVLHAVAIALCWHYLARPTLARRVGLAALVAVSFLFRPDYGVVIGLVTLFAVVWAETGPVRARIRAAFQLAAATAVCMIPWMVFVQSAVGLVTHLRSVLEFTGAKADVGRIGWPPFPIQLRPDPGLASRLDHEAFLYYAFLLLPVVGAIVVFRRGAAAARMPDASGRLWVVIILALCTHATLLRDPLHNRLADVAVPQTILGAWLFTAAWRAAPPVRLPVRLGLRAAAVAMVWVLALSVVRLGNAREQFGHIPILRPDAVRDRAATVLWALRDIDGSAGVPRTERTTLGPFVAYLRACTEPDDRVMYVGYAPETYFFAHRPFAAGQVVFEGSYYTSPKDQELMLARLRREQAAVIALPDEYVANFRQVFSGIDSYLRARYVRVGNIDLPGDRRGDVFLDRARAHRGVYEPLGWPCLSDGSSRT